MAVSPLAQIDWTDLDSADLPLAVNLLAVATQERFNIATVARNGRMRYRFNATDNSGVGTQFTIADRDIFPYKSNDPDWTLNDGDPLGDFTDQVETLIGDMIDVFADTEKWDDADTDGTFANTQYNLGGPADAPGTYDNRLFEITGYTSFPDLSVYAPEEVKKWYDMIVECKVIVRQAGNESTPGQGGFTNDDYFIYDGQFDVEADAFLTSNQDGAEYYGGDPTLAVGEVMTDNTVFAAFKSGNDGLFGTTPTQFDESTDSGTFPPAKPSGAVVNAGIMYDMLVHTFSGGVADNTYFSWNRCWQIKYVADWTDSISAIGFTGKPLSYKNQVRANHTIDTETSFSPVYTFPASTTADDERYYTTNVLTRSGDKDEIAVDHLLQTMTTPANISTLTKGDVIGGEILLRTGSTSELLPFIFLEDWNGEGGFDNYTP